MEYKKTSKAIKDSNDLESLIEKLLSCIGGINTSQSYELTKQIYAKIKEFKKSDNDLIEFSQRAIHSERLAAMGQMAAAISHELRNPLSGIKVSCEYLMGKIKNQPEIIDILINIHNEVIFANNIISNILEYARISKPNLEKASIKKLIEESILTISQQGVFNNIEIKKQIAEDLPVLLFDLLQMRQVFVNLFLNSAEAMLGGGELKIDVSQKENLVIIKIADTGQGIEKSHLEKIFEPFFSTKVKGIGLGLAIVKEIVENHNGNVSVESKLGSGTVVTVSLPVEIAKK